MPRTEKLLAILLRLTALGTLSAAVPLFMPLDWMNQSHRQMGLGDLPDSPVVEYLARSTCAFYAMFGGLLWLLAGHVRKYAPVIRYTAAVGAVFSALITAIDYRLGLPPFWTWTEGPLTLLVCLAILALQWKLADEKV